MTDSDLVKLYQGWMKTASSELKIDPSLLSWNQFQAYVYDWQGKSQEFVTTIKRLGGFTNIKDAAFTPKISPEKLVVHAKAKDSRQLATAVAHEDNRFNKLKEYMTKVFSKPLVLPSKMPARTKFLERHQHLLLSDLHFGSDLDPSVGLRKYGIEEEARSLARIVVETVEHKTQYRKNTKLWVNVNGDIIQGKLHDRESADDLSRQQCRAIDILSQAIALLANNFPEVEVNFATGNHDRITSRHHDRATSSKNDSNAQVIYFAITKILQGFKNVKFNLDLKPYITYKSFNANYYGTHGDTHIRLPNPNGLINVNNLENQINRLNARVSGAKYNLVFCGHVHSGMLLHLTNGVVLVTNPPLMPTDEFGLSLNIDPDAPTGQWLWESVSGHPMGDSRFLKVTEADRNDSSLDKVIKPFTAF